MDAPAPASDVVTAYDNFSRAISVAYAGAHTLTFAYDQLSRNTSATRVAGGATQVLSYQYDLAGRRTRVTWPDGFYAGYDVDVSGAVTAIRENGAASGIGVLASYGYDNYGRRTSVSRGNGVATTYSYDGASLLSALTQDLAASASDQTLAFTYNASGQALTRTGTNADWVRSRRQRPGPYLRLGLWAPAACCLILQSRAAKMHGWRDVGGKIFRVPGAGAYLVCVSQGLGGEPGAEICLYRWALGTIERASRSFFCERLARFFATSPHRRLAWLGC